MNDIDETLNQRQEKYDDFKSHARITQNIKLAMMDGKWHDISGYATLVEKSLKE